MAFFVPDSRRDDLHSVLKPLKRPQDSPGVFNDCAVRQVRLRTLPEGETYGLETARSIDALIIVLHRKRIAERARIVAAFARFNRDAMQQAIRNLFHGGREV